MLNIIKSGSFADEEPHIPIVRIVKGEIGREEKEFTPFVLKTMLDNDYAEIIEGVIEGIVEEELRAELEALVKDVEDPEAKELLEIWGKEHLDIDIKRSKSVASIINVLVKASDVG